MALKQEQIDMLNRPLPPDVIRKREGFDYVEGWWVKAKATEIFGHDGWSTRIVSLDCVVDQEYQGRKGTGYIVGYTCRMVVDVHGVCGHEDVGCGEGIDYHSRVKAHEGAAKEAVTDAMKRAMTCLGNQFGLCLYDKEKKGVADPIQDEVNDLADRIEAMAARLHNGHGASYIDETMRVIREKRGRDYKSIRDLNVGLLKNWSAKLAKKINSQPPETQPEKQPESQTETQTTQDKESNDAERQQGDFGWQPNAGPGDAVSVVERRGDTSWASH